MRFIKAVLLLALSGATLPAAALTALDDAALSDESGAGVAIGLHDFEMALAPTSYFEQVGTPPAGACSAGVTGSVAGNIRCWRRGDLRWYGINISGAGGTNDGYHWNDVITCSSNSLDCPRGGVIPLFSPFDNPYLIRAASPAGMGYDGSCINGTTSGCVVPATPINKAIYEFLAPTAQPNYTFSWWGEIEVGSTRNWTSIPAGTANPLNTATKGSILKSQNIIRGNAAGSVFRMFQFTQPGNQTFAMLYHSYLRGDYRFSVNQSDPDGAGPLTYSDTIGEPTYFSPVEGMTFRNVEAYVPLGQLYYQALTVSPIGTSGNFEILLTPLPATAAVYNKHYGITLGAFAAGYSEDGKGYETARASSRGITLSADYRLTHGYSRWGGWSATGTYTDNGLNTTSDGIIFRACSGCATFYAYADTPLLLDKRSNLPSGGGRSYEEERIQNYRCSYGNVGGCNVAGANNFAQGTTTTPARFRQVGPLATDTASTRTYPTTAVNLGDARIEGLMLDHLRFVSCAAGGC